MSADRPNHWLYDSLGDPLTCTGDHNHPPTAEDEPVYNADRRLA